MRTLTYTLLLSVLVVLSGIIIFYVILNEDGVEARQVLSMASFIIAFQLFVYYILILSEIILTRFYKSNKYYLLAMNTSFNTFMVFNFNFENRITVHGCLIITFIAYTQIASVFVFMNKRHAQLPKETKE